MAKEVTIKQLAESVKRATEKYGLPTRPKDKSSKKK